MTDVTSLCNQALAVVGTRSTISSISEASNEARACLLAFEPTRKQLLRAAHWGFARAYNAFPLILANRNTPEALFPPANYAPGWDARWEPPPPWLYGYKYPTGVIAIRYIVPLPDATQPAIPFTSAPNSFVPSANSGPMPKFEISVNMEPGSSTQKTGVILTNVRKAVFCYTDDTADVTLFDESFNRAFVQALAANLVTSLTGDLKMLDALNKLANAHILEARVKNANESLTVMDHVPDWLMVRGLGPSFGTGPWVPEYGPLFGGSV
jgi:hypothetical protein